MRQGNGSDLLGLKDSRSTKIGIIYVAPNDDRKSILAAVLTQEKLRRKQIVVVLPENQPNKAFQRSQDFDDLKAVRRKLHAQLIFIAPAGPGPAEFARQRRFSVYSSLGSYADALGAEPSLAETRNSLGKLMVPLAGGATAAALTLSNEKDQSVPTASSATNNEIEENASNNSLSPYIDRPTLDLTHVHVVHDLPDQLPVTSATDTQASPKSSVIVASSAAADIVAANLINTSCQQPITSDVFSTTIQDDCDALPPTSSTSSSQTDAHTVDMTPPPTLSSTPDTPDPADGAEPAIIELLPPPRAIPSRATAKLPAIGALAAATSTVQSSVNTPSQKPSAGSTVAIIDANAPAPVLYKETSGRSPVLSSKSAQTGTTRKRPASKGLIVVVLIIAVLLICGDIISCTSGQPLFGFGLFNDNRVPATITITPNSKVEQESYVIQAVTSNADPTKRQISLRQLTFSPPNQSKSVTATGAGHILPKAATGQLTFYNGSNQDYWIGSTTAIPGPNGVFVVPDEPVDIPAAHPPTEGTITVNAHTTTAGTNGNMAAGAINTNCCASGTFVTVVSSAFTGGKDGIDYSYLQRSDVDGIVNQLRSMFSQQAQNSLKGQIKPHEQLLNPPCTMQSSADHPIGDQGQKVTTATITVNATCTGLAYDTGGAQILAQDLLKRKAASDLGPNYVLTGTIMTKQVIIDVQDSVVTLQVAAAGTWYYPFDDNQKQALAKQLANKSRAAAQRTLHDYKGIAKIKIDIANGDTLPDNPEQISIIVLGASGASQSDLPALPTVVQLVH